MLQRILVDHTVVSLGIHVEPVIHHRSTSAKACTSSNLSLNQWEIISRNNTSQRATHNKEQQGGDIHAIQPVPYP